MSMHESLDSEYFKARIKQLEEENASLRETVRQLRTQLSKQNTTPRRFFDDYDYLPYEEDDRS